MASDPGVSPEVQRKIAMTRKFTQLREGMATEPEPEPAEVSEGEPPLKLDALPGRVAHRGWLEKRKPGKKGGWDRRYCLLCGRVLLYYKAGVKKWNSPTGVALVSDGATVGIGETPDTFRIGYADKDEDWTFEMRAPSAASAQAWLVAFGADVDMGAPEMQLAAGDAEPEPEAHLLAVVPEDQHETLHLHDFTMGHDWLEATDDVVVVPSLSLSPEELEKIPGVSLYEERSLGYCILQLCQPEKRVVYATSVPVCEDVVQYYLKLVCAQRGVSAAQARERLLMVSCHDSTFDVNLSDKICARPRMVQRIRDFVRPDDSYMVCFISTPSEANLGRALGLEVLGTPPELQFYGTKLGSRTLFGEAGVLYPDGTDLKFSEAELALAIAELWERSKPRRVVVKLNEGFSGEGNALMTLDQTKLESAKDTAARAKLIEAGFASMEFVGDAWQHFRHEIVKMGALGECWVEDVVTSPSCQIYLTPDGHIEVISTHEQILDGQIFLGCEFPADASYRAALQEGGIKVGKALAKHGGMERFAMDFVTVRRQDGGWDCHAIEINMRW